MDTIERCLNQAFQSEPTYMNGELLDKCSKCSYDPENNIKCPYRGKPMRMLVVEVKERKYVSKS